MSVKESSSRNKWRLKTLGKENLEERYKETSIKAEVETQYFFQK